MKEIVNYIDKNTYCIIVPVYYEHEEKPANRIVYIGSKKECENNFTLYPEYMTATIEENRKNRENKRKEYIFLVDIGKKKEAEKIKELYKL